METQCLAPDGQAGFCMAGTCSVGTEGECICSSGWDTTNEFNWGNVQCSRHEALQYVIYKSLMILSAMNVVLMAAIIAMKIRFASRSSKTTVLLRALPGTAAMAGLAWCAALKANSIHGEPRYLGEDFLVSFLLGFGGFMTYLSCLSVYEKMVNFLMRTTLINAKHSARGRRLVFFMKFKGVFVLSALLANICLPAASFLPGMRVALLRCLCGIESLCSLQVVLFVKGVYDPLLKDMRIALERMQTKSDTRALRRASVEYKSTQLVRRVHLYLNGFNFVLDFCSFLFPAVFAMFGTFLGLRAMTGSLSINASILTFFFRTYVSLSRDSQIETTKASHSKKANQTGSQQIHPSGSTWTGEQPAQSILMGNDVSMQYTVNARESLKLPSRFLSLYKT